MTRQFANSPPLHVRFGDMFVILSVTLLSLAAGAGLISRMGLELSSALLASLAIYCSLLVLHLVVRRSFTEAAQGDDTEDDDAHWQTDARDSFEDTLAEHSPELAPPLPGTGLDGLPPHSSRAGIWPEPLPMPEGEEQRDPAGSHLGQDPFTFRPSRGPYFEDDAGPGQHPLEAPVDPRAEAESPAPPPEVNVDLIQDLIKKLADELNGGPPARDPDAAPETPPPLPGNDTEAMIGRSVAALETATRAMRGPERPQSRRQRPARAGRRGTVPSP